MVSSTLPTAAPPTTIGALRVNAGRATIWPEVTRLLPRASKMRRATGTPPWEGWERTDLRRSVSNCQSGSRAAMDEATRAAASWARKASISASFRWPTMT
mgnify:CR=1 FL=1